MFVGFPARSCARLERRALILTKVVYYVYDLGDHFYRSLELSEVVRRRDDALPRAAGRVEGPRRGPRELRDGDHDGAVVDEAHGEAGVAGHGAVHRRMS